MRAQACSSPPGKRYPTLSTRPAPAASVTGAVHEHRPPGWNGSPARNDQRPAMSATIAGSPAIQRRTPSSQRAVSARYLGTVKAVTPERCRSADGTVNRVLARGMPVANRFVVPRLAR
jgi:hypothetical protein